MPHESPDTTVFRVGELSPNHPVHFDLRPDRAQLDEIAVELDLIGLRKLRLAGTLRLDGTSDWRLDAKLGATVTQSCVVTLDPVTTRIEENVIRRFLSNWPIAEELSDDVEMPEDETIDPLGEEIDINAVMVEALALALPTYPRISGAEPPITQSIPPGADPLDDGTKTTPFAALEKLRGKLENR